MAQKKIIHKLIWIFFIALFLFINFYQMPYYYTQPGDALTLDEVITVENGYEEKGSFMLTTVRMGRATIPFYVWAKLDPYRSLLPIKQIRYEGETEEEYHHRQLMAMKSSQDAAKIVAYKQAHKEVTIEYGGAIVTSLIEGMPAKDELKIGDRIIAVDNEKVQTAEQLVEHMQKKTVEDNVHLTVLRDGKQLTYDIGFAPFPKKLKVPGDKIGIGIANPVTERNLTFSPSVEIDTSQIGGPSAGLMFSLEIYNQLVEEDLTKGHEIAGTGTIDEEGRVGRIGGAGQKVVAADKRGAEYFFAPNEGGAPDSNYREALKVAEEIGSEMIIVPVDTFDDAIEFLEDDRHLAKRE